MEILQRILYIIEFVYILATVWLFIETYRVKRTVKKIRQLKIMFASMPEAKTFVMQEKGKG